MPLNFRSDGAHFRRLVHDIHLDVRNARERAQLLDGTDPVCIGGDQSDIQSAEQLVDGCQLRDGRGLAHPGRPDQRDHTWCACGAPFSASAVGMIPAIAASNCFSRYDLFVIWSWFARGCTPPE